MWNKIIAVGTVFVGCTVTVVGGLMMHRTHELSKKFDKSVQDLEKTTENDISKTLIETAVNSAAKNKVNNYVDHIGDAVLADSKQQINDAVRKAVASAKSEILDQVSERISAEAELIDIEDLKKSIRSKAEARVISKFDGSLDDLLGKFNENLSNVQKIYNGISEAMGKKDSNKEIKFSLG